eukprot:1302533-Pleurochrysis_carterae.AAC.1
MCGDKARARRSKRCRQREGAGREERREGREEGNKDARKDTKKSEVFWEIRKGEGKRRRVCERVKER